MTTPTTTLPDQDGFPRHSRVPLAFGAISSEQRRAALEKGRVLDAPDLAADPTLQTNQQRLDRRAALLERLAEILKAHEIVALSAKLEAAGLPYAPIRRPDQLTTDPHLKASGGLVPMQCDDGSSTDVVLLPLLMDGSRLGVLRPLPGVGEHTEEILGTLKKQESC